MNSMNSHLDQEKFDHKKSAHANKGKVLIIDDKLLHLESARLYLEKSGFKVFCATDTINAWTLIMEEEPELVLLDVVLPGESGLNLLSKIKSDYPSIGVIIMTAYGSENIAATALRLGAIDYIRKPIKYGNLGSIIEKALEKQREENIKEINIENLRLAYEKLQVSADSILQCMSAGVVVVDENFNIKIINEYAKKLFNISGIDCNGKPYLFPILEDNGVLHNTFKNEKGVRKYELNLSDENGEKIILLNTDVIYDSNLKKIGAIAVFEDITEYRRKEEFLREREKLSVVGQLATCMAHEIKNPLTAIKGFTQVLSRKAEDQSMKNYLHIILEEANRMNQIVQDFLQLANPKLPVLKMCNINGLVNEITLFVEPQALLKKIYIQVKTDDAIPDSLMDPNQIKQVLLNFIQNAMEAIENDGIIDIETIYIAEKNEICIKIYDTGCGIPATEIEKLSIPFFTTKPEGTGLGLSISYAIVDSHQGYVEVQSKEGYGTVFSIFFPLIK